MSGFDDPRGLPRWLRRRIAAVLADGVEHFGGSVVLWHALWQGALAATELTAYAAVCLAVQLALSHPRRLAAAAAGLRARLRAAVSRLRLGALVVARGVGGYDRVRTTAV